MVTLVSWAAFRRSCNAALFFLPLHGHQRGGITQCDSKVLGARECITEGVILIARGLDKFADQADVLAVACKKTSMIGLNASMLAGMCLWLLSEAPWAHTVLCMFLVGICFWLRSGAFLGCARHPGQTSPNEGGGGTNPSDPFRK